MTTLILEKIISSIRSADLSASLKFIKENKEFFSDPLAGAKLHAKVLYFAIKYGRQPVVEYLMDLAIYSDIAFYNFCGHTPISLILEENCELPIALVLDKTDKVFALHMAQKLNQKKTITFLTNIASSHHNRISKFLKISDPLAIA